MQIVQKKQKLQHAGILLAMFLLMLAPMAQARPGHGSPSHENGHHGFGEPPPGLFEELNLSDQQFRVIKQIHTKARKQAIPLNAELKTLQLDLEDTISHDAVTLEDVDAFADKIGHLRTQLLKNRLKTQIAIRQVLTPKQRLEMDKIKAGKKGKRFSKSGRGGNKHGRF